VTDIGRRTTALALVVLWAVAHPVPAWAHGVDATADQSFAQTIAGNELTVVIRRTEAVPGPLNVDVIAHRPVRGQLLSLRVGSTSDRIALEADRPGLYPAVLQVHRTGPHELSLRSGGEISALPFEVPPSSVPLPDLLVYGSFGAAGVLLIGALVAGASSRPLPAALLGCGALVGLVVGITVGFLSPRLEPSQADASGLGRPYVQAEVGTTPAAPRAGDAVRLRLDLTDGATGRPVDDLVNHHAALAHLVVTSADGGFFAHVHPVRTAPGRLEARLVVDRPGRYLVHAELERVSSGGQLVTGEFRVRGVRAGDEIGDATKPAIRPGRPVAGRPATIEFDTGSADLQAWLGMAGHLIVRSRDGELLGHVHESSSMANAASGPVPDETVAVYGPRLRFTYSFPKPGRYFAWIQFERDFRIESVPFVIDVVREPSSA
jgi:hypothetical protein